MRSYIVVVALLVLIAVSASADSISTLANQNLETLSFTGSNLNVNATVTPSGTQDVNVKSVNGVAVGNALPTVAKPTDSACKTVTGDADVTVDNTAGGVTVLSASATRCGAVIVNTASSGNDMRCLPALQTVTSSFGTYVSAGGRIVLGLEGQQAWKCIRVGGSNATANPTEVTP